MEKQAQIVLNNNPEFVAKEIKTIIDIMISRMSPEARMRAYPNLREKIKALNFSEIASKKSPGGASIGNSITLVKNILNGRDAFFVRMVIEHLARML